LGTRASRADPWEIGDVGLGDPEFVREAVPPSLTANVRAVVEVEVTALLR